MAEWKNTGCVPDSDDEDESQETAVVERSNPPSASQSSVVVPGGFSDEGRRNEENLRTAFLDGNGQHKRDLSSQCSGISQHNHGPHPAASPNVGTADETSPEESTATPDGRSILDLLPPGRPLNAAEAAELVSRTSSPLSDAPSSFPELSDLFQLAPKVRFADHDEFVVPPYRAEAHENDQETINRAVGSPSRQQMETTQVTRLARTFRNRKPIQLHPYMIESAQYNREQRDHGLRPVRLVQEGANSEENASQPTDSSTENHIVAPSTLEPATEPSATNLSTLTPTSFSEEEFPDIDAIPIRSPRQAHTVKRRKLNLPEPNVISSSVRRKAHRLIFDDAEHMKEASETSAINQAPRRSRSSSEVEEDSPGLPRFRMPHGLQKRGLPTPATSSETGGHLSRAPSVVQVLSDAASSDLEEGSELGRDEGIEEVESNTQLQQAQRRIRGVLPASWLKLDLKAQAHKSDKEPMRRSNSSPTKETPLRGVARYKEFKALDFTSNQRRKASVFVLSDDSDSSDPEGAQQSERIPVPFPSNNPPRLRDPLANPGEEAMEADTIDAMLPSLQRHRRNQRRQKGRQTKLRDFGLHKKDSHSRSKGAAPPKNQERQQTMAYSEQVKKKPRVYTPRLGILDAPAPATQEGKARPAFIRVASRTARHRHNKGRSQPRNKYIQLPSTEDDADVQETLNAWRYGKIARKPRALLTDGSGRPPLQPRSVNSPVVDPAPKSANSTALVEDAISNKPDRMLSPKLIQADKFLKMPSIDEARSKAKNIQTKFSGDNTARPALLETSYVSGGSKLRPSFGQKLHQVSLEFSHLEYSRLLQKRSLRENVANSTKLRNSTVSGVLEGLQFPNDHITARPPKPHRKRVRKRVPKRTQPAEVEITEPDCFISAIDTGNDNLPEVIRVEIDSADLVGFGPFGMIYADTFEVEPLRPGTAFHSNTFLGSGEFMRCYHQRHEDTESAPSGYASIEFQGRILSWGPWNENVSSEIFECFEYINQETVGIVKLRGESHTRGNNVLNLQKLILSYLTSNLRFYDSIDRLSFLQSLKLLIRNFLQEFALSGHGALRETTRIMDRQICLQILTLNVVIANKVRQLSEHEIVTSQSQIEMRILLSDSVVAVCESMKEDMASIQETYFHLSNRTTNNDLLNDSDHPIESLVIVHHIIAQSGLDVSWLRILCVEDQPPIAMKHCDIGQLERYWKQLFHILPFLEIGDQGVLEVGRRFGFILCDWTLVKQLMGPVLDAYISKRNGQAPNFNNYCRALFRRCLHLINGWGWYRCESIIGTLFDFFARNNLGHLRNEASQGSPSFLMHLDIQPSLHANPEDRCFHLLLKIIASGLLHMRKTKPEKKIRDLAWRLMPNHGRFYPKDQPIRQEDLDALRNHHDLLCTLYWASPQGYRPSLVAIRNLVDLENSHREACRIAICTWRNLAKFQVSANESLMEIAPFRQWHQHLLSQMLRQYSSARTEADDLLRTSGDYNSAAVSKSLLEEIITSNQKTVEDILDDALVALQVSIESCTQTEVAAALVSPCIRRVFDLFDGSRTHVNRAIVSGLSAILALTKLLTPSSQTHHARKDNDDSQDYGDWSAFDSEEQMFLQPFQLPQPIQESMSWLDDSLRSLLSNCFGADMPPTESFLCKLLDVWVRVAHLSVLSGRKSWADYVGHYGKDSWTSLRDTSQTRKYLPYFLASVVVASPGVYQAHRSTVLSAWVASLLERESLLKYQHQFTNALLNNIGDETLLTNLPFIKNTNTHQFEITASELSERRLALLSSVLSNLRASNGSSDSKREVQYQAFRQENKGILKSIMTTLRQNYEESSQRLDMKGAYVDFTHRLIQLLQEHTSEIHPVDSYFTDNIQFPLPSADPSYVTGRLKNYALRLQDSGTPKQLVVFLQALSERSAVNGTQIQFSAQLHSALSETSADRGSRQHLLRFMIQSVLPAYVRAAVHHSCGWIVAIPLIHCLQKVFAEVFNDLDVFHADSARSTEQCVGQLLAFSQAAVTSMQLEIEPRRPIRSLANACFEAVTAALPAFGYLSQKRGPKSSHISALLSLHTVADDLIRSGGRDEHGSEIIQPCDIRSASIDFPADSVSSFAFGQLRDSLNRNWTLNEDEYEYYFTRGTLKCPINIDIWREEFGAQQTQIVLARFQTSLMKFAPFLDCFDDDIVHRNRLPTGLEGVPLQ